MSELNKIIRFQRYGLNCTKYIFKDCTICYECKDITHPGAYTVEIKNIKYEIDSEYKAITIEKATELAIAEFDSQLIAALVDYKEIRQQHIEEVKLQEIMISSLNNKIKELEKLIDKNPILKLVKIV